MSKRHCRLLIFFLLFNIKAFSQHFAMLNYTADNGMPSNTVYNIFRDHNGLLWFGTDKGTVTFDGTTFNNYTTFDGLADNDIFFFQEDYFNRVWMSTFNAKLSYYIGGRFYKAENNPYLGLPIKASVTKFIILEDDSSVTISFLNYPIIVNILKDHRTIIDLKGLASSLELYNIISVKKVNKNRYRIYMGDKVALVDTNAKLISVSPYSNGGRYLYSINQNQEYFLDSNSIYSKDFKKLFTTGNMQFGPRGACIYNDGKDFYIANTHGLFINNEYQLLGNCKVTSVTQDLNGNYWIGTLGSGVYMLSKDYKHTMRYENCYKGKIKYAFADNKGLYYVNTENMLYRFDRGKTEDLVRFSSHSDRVPSYAMQGKHLYVFCDCDFFNIDNIDAPQVIVTHYETEQMDYIKSIYPNANNFYLATPNDILKLSFKAKRWASSQYKYKNLTNGRWPRLYAMGFDIDQRIWCSTIDSVFTIDTSGEIAYQPQLGAHSFKWGRILGKYMVCCTNNNELLVGIHTTAGIIDTIIQQPYVWTDAFQLDSNHLLIGSNNLYRLLTLYPTDNKPRLQLQVLEYPVIPSAAEYVTADSNTCYFFKKGTITAIDKAILFQKATAPVVYFTVLKTHDHLYAMDSVIKLSYNDSRHVNIQFNVISNEGQQLTYEYSISKNGVDIWHEISGHEINLAAPAFGTYAVKLRARSASSTYSKTAYFRLIINKPYWASWWFILLLSLGIILLFSAFAYYVFSRALRKKQEAHEVEMKFLKSEYKVANALMNPHFMFNSLNSIQYFINNDNKISATKYLNIFSKMLRQNMFNISKEMISLQSEIDLVINYLNLEKLRFKDWLNFTIDIDENLELEIIKVPPLLLQPIVENAIKHGLLPKQSTDNHIHISVVELNGDIRIEIQDNGVGLNRTSQSSHSSFALENIKNRISQLHAIYGKEISLDIKELKDNNGNVLGTRSSIVIRAVLS